MLLPLILGGGLMPVLSTLLSLPLHLLALLEVESGSSSSGLGWLSFFGTLVLTVLLFGTVMLVRQFGRHGVLPTLRRLLLTGWHGGGPQRQRGPGGQQQQQGRPGGGAARRPAGTQQERFERVTHLVQALPTEVYRSREELEGLSGGELKELLRKLGALKAGAGPAAAAPLEKRELIDLLQSGANSSSTSCPICVEDYASGDVLRALPCGHRFHLECIDKWLLSSTDYSRPPACPMCNAEVAAPAAGIEIGIEQYNDMSVASDACLARGAA
ncbi:hypothetical protein N2152v2_001137 [Parachlorella kessleri]